MRALFSYNRALFDPSVEKHYTGTSLIGRIIYEACTQVMSSVEYVDAREQADHVRGKHFDVLIGEATGFDSFASDLPLRFRILIGVSTKNLITKSRLSDTSPKFEVAFESHAPDTALVKASRKAQFVLVFGNDYLLSAYRREGIDREKILNVHKGIDPGRFQPRNTLPKTNKFLYLVSPSNDPQSDLNVLTTLGELPGEFGVSVVGLYGDSAHDQRLSELCSNSDTLGYLGYVGPADLQYKRLLATHNFVVCPTFSESEPQQLLEAMGSGLIPIVSRESGIDFSPLGFFECAKDNLRLFRRAIALSPNELLTFSRQAREFVEAFHNESDFRNRIVDILRCICEGRLQDLTRPKVSIVLPIFNKEKTIVPLLRALVGTTRSYGNTEYNFIFDGCRDRSEGLARKYLTSKGLDVKFFVTPDIFETLTNNLGLKAASGKYCIVLQDDIFLFEPYWLEKMVFFMESHPRVGVLGGLHGSNVYPVGTTFPEGDRFRTTSVDATEHIEFPYHSMLKMVVQTDIVNRGPLVLRKSLLESFGYLDEAYVPLYADDLDLCFRLRAHGYRTMLYPLNVVNARLTAARYDSHKALWFEQIIRRNLARVYERWRPGPDKSAYISLPMPIFNNLVDCNGYRYGLAVFAALISRGLFDLRRWIRHPFNLIRWISPSRAESLKSAWKGIVRLVGTD